MRTCALIHPLHLELETAHYKLVLLTPAIGHSPEIHHLDGSDNLPFDAEIQMPHHLSGSEQSTPFLSTPDGRISQELVVA